MNRCLPFAAPLLLALAACFVALRAPRKDGVVSGTSRPAGIAVAGLARCDQAACFRIASRGTGGFGAADFAVDLRINGLSDFTTAR